MKVRPKVSVVIPSFNRAHILEKTIPGYFQEDVGEVIVVNDCSTDGTTRVLQNLKNKYKKLVIINNNKNLKQTGSKNKGVASAKFDYIYFGDDDSYLIRGSIKHLLDVMLEKRSEITSARSIYMLEQETEEMALTRCDKYAKKVEDICNVRNMNANFSLRSHSPIQVYFSQAPFLIRKEIALEILFSRVFFGNCLREETDFLIRAAAKGYTNYYVSTACQINLPRRKATGGAHNRSVPVYYIQSFINNGLFVAKNLKNLVQLSGSYYTPIIVLFNPLFSFTLKAFRKNS